MAAVLLPASDTAQAQTAPTVSAVAVSSDAGADTTYALGETIRVTLTFSEAVVVTGTPKLKIDMDPAHWGEKVVPYASGSGGRTASLAFAHVDGDRVSPPYPAPGHLRWIAADSFCAGDTMPAAWPCITSSLRRMP